MAGADARTIALAYRQRRRVILIKSILTAARTLAGCIFSFEASLVMFMFAGYYKSDPRFSWIPVDLTLLFFVVSGAAGLWILFRKGLPVGTARLWLVMIFAVLVAYAVITSLWTPSLIYVNTKLPYFVFLSFWCLAATALIIAGDPVRYQRFFYVMLLFSLWIASESFFSFLHSLASGTAIQFVLALGSNYLGLGRAIGPGLLVLLTYALYIVRVTWIRVFLAGLSLFYLVLLLTIGGRTPFAAAVIGILVVLWPLAKLGGGPKRVLWQMAGLLTVIVVLVSIWWYLHNTALMQLPTTLRRFSTLAENPRYKAYEETLLFVDDSPVFGLGIASWPVVLGRGDMRLYPHNIFLEIWFELGMVGLLLFCAMLFVAFWQIGSPAKLRASPLSLLALALFVNALINSSTAGDIHENRFIFATIGLLMLAGTERYLLAMKPRSSEDGPPISRSYSPKSFASSVSQL